MTRVEPGAEVDAWCTHCRLDLTHRVVAMVGSAVKRVVCMTCNREHNYHRPRAGSAGERPTRARAPRAPGERPRRQAVPRGERGRLETWQQRCAEAATGDFVPYSIERVFREEQLVHHEKFGPGYVVSVLEGGKVRVMFREGERTLAHGQG